MAGGGLRTLNTSYAVLGHPIEHSLSPTIHRTFADQLGITLSYQSIDVEPGEFAEFWQRGPGQKLAGANVTIPLKQLAYELCDEVGANAKEAGAVNTIAWRDQKLFGFNTDGVGLLTDLMQNLAQPINGKRLLLIGAGGAARGILGPLLRQAPRELVIANRTLRNAEWIFEQYREQVSSIDGLGMCISALADLDQAGQFDGIINATSLGHNGGRFNLPASLLQNHSWCYDLSYGSAAKPFTTWAATSGCRVVHDGLGMLVEQAAESFRHWHGLSPRTAPVLRSVRLASQDGA